MKSQKSFSVALAPSSGLASKIINKIEQVMMRKAVIFSGRNIVSINWSLVLDEIIELVQPTFSKDTVGMTP